MASDQPSTADKSLEGDPDDSAWKDLPPTIQRELRQQYLPGFPESDIFAAAQLIRSALNDRAGESERYANLVFLAAYYTLLQRYGTRLMAYVGRTYQLSSLDAYDTVEDAITAFLRAQKRTVPSSPIAYLYRQVRWKAIDRLRRADSLSRPLDPAASELASSLTTLDDVENDASLDQVLAALARIEPQAAAIFRDWQAFNYDDKALTHLAKRYQLSEKTIRRRLALARNFLRQHLAQGTDAKRSATG